eukprot:431392_1
MPSLIRGLYNKSSAPASYPCTSTFRAFHDRCQMLCAAAVSIHGLHKAPDPASYPCTSTFRAFYDQCQMLCAAAVSIHGLHKPALWCLLCLSFYGAMARGMRVRAIAI